MSFELSYLVWSVALTFVQVLIAVSLASLAVPLPKLMGNREDMPDLKGLAGRATRAHLNMMENLPLFIALVLVAQIAGRTNQMTHWGVLLFFWGRVAHAIIYLAGIPGLRTLAWLVSVVGMVMIFLQLL
jgi:uncharacterized MAPEG superfamily protein